MNIFVLVGVLGVLLSELGCCSCVMTAIVGQLFTLNVSMVNEFPPYTNLPNWICSLSSKNEGIPVNRDVNIYNINDHLSIAVTAQFTFYHCTHRWPTIFVILINTNISSLSGCERLQLWQNLKNYWPGDVSSLRLVEDVPRLMKSLSILAQWKYKRSIKKSNIAHSAIISHIGCGFIPEKMLSHLKSLESESNIDKLSNLLSILIHGWIVADQFDPIIVRKRRHSKSSYLRFSEFTSIFYQQEKQQKQEWNEAKIIIEGSGLFDENWTPPIITNKKTINYNKTSRNNNNNSEIIDMPQNKNIYKKNTMPIVKRKLENFTIYLGTKMFYQIPPQTFFDEEDGYNQPSENLKLKIFLRNKESKTDRQIYLNTEDWIYFLQKEQVICLQPLKANAGQCDLTVCAYDSDKNRICDGIKIFIKKPQPITKTTHINGLPGVLWKHRLASDWAEIIKYSKNDSLLIKIQSSSLISWQSNISMISLITEASVSKEYKIKVTAESHITGKTYILMIIVTTSGLNAYIEATSPEIVLSLNLLENKKVPFEIINILKEKLRTVISTYWRITSSPSRDILLYRIISGAKAFLNQSTEESLVLSFVYSPRKSLTDSSTLTNCSDVLISPGLLEKFKFSLKKHFFWVLQSIYLINIHGKCIFDPNVLGTFPRVSTTPRTILSEPEDLNISELLNKTISLEVRNGFTFKKIIVFPFQPIFKFIRSMQLLDNNLVIDESSWVFLATTEFAICGLPLLENVRKQPYLFQLEVTLVSGRIKFVVVNIVVEKFAPNFNHKFGIIISITERDTVELERAGLHMNSKSLRTMGQLLVSQTLSYRWLVVQALAGYLNSNQCVGDCGTNIFIYSFSEPKSWQINITWSIVFNSPASPEYPTVYTVASCSDSKLKATIRSLLFADQFTDSMIESFSSSVYSFAARPNHNLIKSFKSKYLGTPSWVNAESSGPCTRPADQTEIDSSGVVLWSNISVFQGSIFALDLDTKQNFKERQIQRVQHPKIFFTNGSICKMNWVKLSENGRIIYGLPLLSDGVIESYFSLRIHLQFPDKKDRLNYYMSISIKSSKYSIKKTHIVNMTIMVQQAHIKYINDLDYKIRIARSINSYLHPSCTLGNKTTNLSTFKLYSLDSFKKQFLQFCENAEDIILYAVNERLDSGNILYDILWSQLSVSSKSEELTKLCDLKILQDLNGNLFENVSLQIINKELISFLHNLNLGRVVNVQLHLFEDCIQSMTKNQIVIPHIKMPTELSSEMYKGTSNASTKIVLGIFGFLIILISCICLIIYFVKRGLPSSFTRLTDKNVKSVALEDFNSGAQTPLKSPVSSFVKKPKNIQTMESIGPGYSNNSPKTPLLSQFSKEESKSDKAKESVFNDGDATGSYSYAAVCHPQSPEPEIPAPNNSTNTLTKQPTNVNVIRNPAMMMGSRLNPYRNIPPPII